MPSASVLKSGTFLPLFSLNTIVDTDLGILNYVFKEFRNDRYFDLNVLDYMELINKVYYRSFKNPLYVIMKNPDNEEDKKFLDECYDEFIVDKEFEILSNSLSTQMMEIIKMFINEGNIIPTIMYYSQAQLDYIQSIIDFDNIPAINHEEAIAKSKSGFSQFYLKYIEELMIFSQVENKTFYLSNCGLNLNENHDDIRVSELVDQTLLRRNQINIIDLYRQDIIGKDIYRHDGE